MGKKRSIEKTKNSDDGVIKRKMIVRKKYNLRSKSDGGQLNKLMVDENKFEGGKKGISKIVKYNATTIIKKDIGDAKNLIVTEKIKTIETGLNNDYNNLVKIQEWNNSASINKGDNSVENSGRKLENILEEAEVTTLSNKSGNDNDGDAIEKDTIKSPEIVNNLQLKQTETEEKLVFEGDTEDKSIDDINKINEADLESMNDSEIVDDPLPKSSLT